MLTAPNKTPRQFGFKEGDTHLVVNAISKTVKAYSYNGTLLWEKPALPEGQNANWKINKGDTPPGLYRIGKVYDDIGIHGMNPNAYTEDLLAYGWVSFDLVDLEGNEDNNGRAGIMIHGGGSAAGTLAWSPMQPLYATHGCIRMHNIHLRDFVLPLVTNGTVFVSVHQDEN